MPSDSQPTYHTDYETYAFADLRRAISLDDARHEVKMMLVHDKPAHLNPNNLARRNQILSIAQDILKTQSRKYIDMACKNWAEYNKYEKELNE